MNQNDVKEVVKLLSDKGIRLVARYEPLGCDFCLKTGDVPAFLEDKIAFFASECGLSREEYVEWREFMKAGAMCGASIKRGSCSRPVKGGKTLTPQDYFERKKAGTLRCSRHGG